MQPKASHNVYTSSVPPGWAMVSSTLPIAPPPQPQDVVLAPASYPEGAAVTKWCAAFRPTDSYLDRCKCGLARDKHTRAQLDAWLASLDMLGRK
jgi:hypothetical protein